MPQARFKVGETLRALIGSFEENRALIVNLTVGFAALNALSALLDVAGPAGIAISLGITLLLGAAYGGLITALICLPGNAQAASELWVTVKPVLARLVWVTLVTIVCGIAGFAALIVPGLIIITIWSVAGQAVVVERTAIFESLGRSFELVKGNGWRVFGYLVIIGLLSMLMLGLALMVAYPLGEGAAANVVSSFLGNLLSTPIVAIGSAALYMKLAGLERTELPEETDPFAPH